jgi:putative acetyltransferase
MIDWLIMKIKKAGQEHLETILNLFRNTIQEVNKKDYNEQERIAWAAGAEDKERWADKINSQYFVFAEMNGKMAGFSSIDPKGYLDTMFVDKTCQNKGVASFLYAEMERRAIEQQNEAITSDISITARPFFESRGFLVLQEQQVPCRGVVLTNYKMQKILNQNIIK